MPEILFEWFDIALNLDQHLQYIIGLVGRWSYVLFAVVVFCETGLVVAGFLPTDTLLFAAGAITSLGTLQLLPLLLAVTVAAIAGDSLNYAVGAFMGQRAFRGRLAFIQRDYIEPSRALYDRYGGRIVLIARFIPLLRTLAPLAAGAYGMRYRGFLFYNALGNVLWVGIMLFGGFFFGQMPTVQNNFWLVLVALVLISFSPLLIERVNHIRQMNNPKRFTTPG